MVFDDPLSIAGALAGAALAVVLLIRLDWWRAPPPDVRSATQPKSVPTGYASTAQPTATPVLIAVAAALVGVGLALSSAGLSIGLAPLVLGGAVLVMAFVLLVRGRPPASAEMQEHAEGAGSEDASAD
jgi:hypothetical protein